MRGVIINSPVMLGTAPKTHVEVLESPREHHKSKDLIFYIEVVPQIFPTSTFFMSI